MSVNSVSFGKVILVKAPLVVAEEITDLANGRNKTALSKQVKSIINDRKYGKAHAYPSNNSKGISYIFSGKEGRKFWRSHREAWDRMNNAPNTYRDDLVADIAVDYAWRKHNERVDELINSSKMITIMGVEYDKSGNIKSINVNA